MLNSNYPVVNDYLNLVERAEATKDSILKQRLEAQALRALAVMTTPASREAVAQEEAARARGRVRRSTP